MGRGSGVIPQFIVIKFPWDLFGLDNTKEKRISSVQTLQIMNVPKRKRYALELAGEGRCWPTRGVSLTPEHGRKIVEPLFTGLWVCILWECPEDTNYFMGPSAPMAKAAEQQDSSANSDWDRLIPNSFTSGYSA